MFIPIPAYTYRISHSGNSITAGTYLPSVTDRYADVLQSMLNNTRFSTIVGAYPGLPTYNPIDPTYSLIGRYTWDTYPGGPNVYQLPPIKSMATALEITNELYGIPGATPDSVLLHWSQYINMLRATGYFPIYAFTVLPRPSTPTQESARLEVNARLLYNPGLIYGDTILNIADLPQLKNNTDQTYYLPDDLHPNSNGHIVIAKCIYRTMFSQHLN